MSAATATVLTALATLVLAIVTLVSAVYAAAGFRKQAQELAIVQNQVRDQHHQLELQRQQLEDQRQANALHGQVLELQAREIRASLEQREHDADEERRSQATKPTAWLERSKDERSWETHIRNGSDQPVYDVRTFFHEIRKRPGEGWEPVLHGELPPRDETVCVFPPGTRCLAVPGEVQTLFQEVIHQEVTDRTCVVSITFTDVAGNRWERDPRDALIVRS